VDIQVDSAVKLEVADWGGTGEPLVRPAGLGNNVHVFDPFAPKLKTKYPFMRLRGEGLGPRAHPPTDSNYSANRLDDDVISVLDALQLTNSIAGEELSSIGSRHPEPVASLVYLDAGYQYAAYDQAQPDFGMDRLELMNSLTAIREAVSPREERKLLTEIAAALPTFENDVKNSWACRT